MGKNPVSQQKKISKKDWKLGGWKKLTVDEFQQNLDDRKTWNLGGNNTGYNMKQATLTKDEMNWYMKHPQSNSSVSKKFLAYFSKGNNPDNNSVETSESIKWSKAKKEKFRN